MIDAKRRFVGSASICMLAGSAALAIGCSEDAGKNMETNANNLETQVARVEISGQRFNIPVRYMYRSAIEKYRQWPRTKKERVTVGAVGLSMLLPDLRPYYPEDDARWKVRGHGERVDVDIMKPVGRDDWYQWVIDDLSNEIAQGKATIMAEQDGLVHVSRMLSETYYPAKNKGELLIGCDKNNPKLSPSCKVKSNYRSGVVLEYYFGLDFLPMWQQVDNGLKELLDRFSLDAQSENEPRRSL